MQAGKATSERTKIGSLVAKSGESLRRRNWQIRKFSCVC